jgi:hypothetical protein
MKCTSDAQIAVLNVRRSNSPGPGMGSAVSRTCNRPSLNTTARNASASFIFSNNRYKISND